MAGRNVRRSLSTFANENGVIARFTIAELCYLCGAVWRSCAPRRSPPDWARPLLEAWSALTDFGGNL